MSELTFAEAGWSAALWLVGIGLAVLCWLEGRRSDLLARFMSSTMQRRLVSRQSVFRRWMSLGLLGLSAVSLVIALMRPQWGLKYLESPRVGAQIMVCLDVSRSMMADDTAPNRLRRAKAEVTDLLSYLDGDQVGLIGFAGRATVLCPLTPDYGFFKLILDAAGPHSVGRGGTKLEAPIRKALDGFRTESDVSRLLVLITDGEDHDSHPLDAARAAAERGVTILAIGFGDEGGSELSVTDPRSGVRTPVLDQNGQPVVTRLDGQTLRDMALATGGAYIPAGTGALDLNSIYEAHIAPLVRGRMDQRRHAVPNELYQWAVLAGLVFFVGSVMTGRAALLRSRQLAGGAASGAGAAAAAVVLIGLIATPQVGWGQAAPPDGQAVDGPESSSAEPTDPRAVYNQALDLLDSDHSQAERLLTRAREHAGRDAEVRFRCAYNLGWVSVKRADALLKDEPQEALASLRSAADWFRDAVRLRPGHSDARYNLDVVLRRALELADSLSTKDPRDLTQRLDDLIQAQRATVSASRRIVQDVALQAADPNAADRFRTQFRHLAVNQRKVISDTQATTETAGEELEALRAQEEALSPEQRIRIAQLTSVLEYLNRASQRLGQARSQMRRRQDRRAFRRAASGLTELKRARDQLRGPVEVLDALLADAVSHSRLTAVKRDQQSTPAVPLRPSAPSRELSWLTRELLVDQQQSVTERTVELTDRLQAAIDQHEEPSEEEASSEASSVELLARVREAVPWLVQGRDQFRLAGQALEADELGAASEKQAEAIVALREARERFLDIRGLIELTYGRQREVGSALSAARSVSGATAPQPPRGVQSSGRGLESDWTVLARAAHQRQIDNLERAGRLADLIQAELTRNALPPEPQAGSAGPNGAQSESDAQRERLEKAEELLKAARQHMPDGAEALEDSLAPPRLHPRPPREDALAPGPEAAGKLAAAASQIDNALEQLQEMRRLFFSIVEHLQETAHRQSELNDATEHAAGLGAGSSAGSQMATLQQRQRELSDVSELLAGALREQAESPAAPPGAPPADPQAAEQQQQIAEKYASAAELVSEGKAEMDSAHQQLGEAGKPQAPPPGAPRRTGEAADGGGDATPPANRESQPPLDQARLHQDAALEKLLAAIAQLRPPQQQENRGEDSQPQDQQESGEQQQTPAGHQNKGLNAARLLQAVRDRDARRRREREQSQRFGREPVEKDW